MRPLLQTADDGTVPRPYAWNGLVTAPESVSGNAWFGEILQQGYCNSTKRISSLGNKNPSAASTCSHSRFGVHG